MHLAEKERERESTTIFRLARVDDGLKEGGENLAN